ncbi:MAG: MlaD family protein [Desulfobacteraceae bacterium]
MATQDTKFRVGLFVLGGIVIALGGLIWLGMSELFREGTYYLTYFDESVQGLDVNSPVKYRGVSVGRVERIRVAPDSELIEVELKIEKLEGLEQDLVAQLKSVGITGMVFVELDRRRPGDRDRSPRIDFPTKHPVIPSKPSEISELIKGVDDVLRQVRAIDLEGISNKMKLTLDGVNKAVTEARIGEVAEGLSSTIEELNRAVERISRVLDPQRWDRLTDSVEEATGSIKGLLDNAGRTVSTTHRTVSRVEDMLVENRDTIRMSLDEFNLAMKNTNRLLDRAALVVGNTDETIIGLRRRLLYTAENLEAATSNLKRITEILADQPSRLIYGGPQPPQTQEFGD